MKRFVLAPGRLQVSLPGYDVDTCDLSHLAFDARFSAMAVYRRGIVQTVGNAVGTYYFGETLSAPPIVLFNCHTSVGAYVGPMYRWWTGHLTEYVFADSYTDRIEFHTTSAGANTFRFIVIKSQ